MSDHSKCPLCKTEHVWCAVHDHYPETETVTVGELTIVGCKKPTCTGIVAVIVTNIDGQFVYDHCTIEI